MQRIQDVYLLGILTMLLFLDTEYTGFGQISPGLISLALVAEDGSREFYAELADTWTPNECTPFVRREVLPLLAGTRLSRDEARVALRIWFQDAPRTVRIACDSETDWRFLLDLLGTPLPRNLADRYYDLRPLIDATIYDCAVTAYYETDARIHHALVDARAYRAGWLAWMDSRKSGARSPYVDSSAEQLLIFLDFDGVLHRFEDRHSCPYSKLPDFEKVLRLNDQAKIVITSSLREEKSLWELRRIFSSDTQARIIGATPILPLDSAVDLPGSRYREILLYLKEHPAKRWVALDDDASLFPPGCLNLIVCERGFDDRAAKQLENVLASR